VILQRVLMAVAAVAALAAAAVIAMVALAFAIFGFLKPEIGAADASAAVAAVFAALIGLGGLLSAQGVGMRSRRRARKGEPTDGDAAGLIDRLMDLARDRPVAAIGVAVALGIFLMRSPSALAAIARAFFETFTGAGQQRR
jgi:hypothetical protein